jgi:hypothetical protein
MAILTLITQLVFSNVTYANPAQIIGIGEVSGSVGYVTWNNNSGLINAQIGRWDTPFPGQQSPHLEPEGKSILYIDIDVNDGGIASFKYQLKTYDIGSYDWLDVDLIPPYGNVVSIIDHLSRPGQWDGQFWKSVEQTTQIKLTQWINQSVRIKFSVEQDGWGDQTTGVITNFFVSTCQVPPLTPLTDPVAIQFENGNTINTDPQYFNLGSNLNCLKNAVTNYGGSYSLKSAYRPVAYQKHLREVYYAWKDLKGRREAECEDLLLEVKAEAQKHGIAYPPAVTSNHSKGNAFDLAISGLSNNQIDSAAQGCGLYRFAPIKDKNHFSPSP